MVLADYQAYIDCQEKVSAAYKDQDAWVRLSILNAARKALAMKLLTETDEAVSAIAYEVGFENPSHFGRAFKKWSGQSPSEFRERQ